MTETDVKIDDKTGSAFARAAFFLLLFLFARNTAAATEYELEVLVFTQTSGQDDEVFVSQSEASSRLNLELKKSLGRDSDLEVEPAIGGDLMEAADRIRRDPRYTILYHVRWQQRTADLPQAPFVRLHIPATGSGPSLDGYIRLYNTGLLYVDALLKYSPLATFQSFSFINDASRSPFEQFFISEKRRVKFGEVHYLDHPRFGALLSVNSIELPDPPPPQIQG